jgi:hypothetical protein
MPLMGVLLLITPATAASGIVVVVAMLDIPPLPPSRLCAVLTPTFGSSAAAVYCYGWFSVTMGGPFPGMCEDRSASGAELASIEQGYRPLRSACVHSDGATSEYISMSINVLVCVLVGLAIVAACAGAILRRRARSSSGCRGVEAKRWLCCGRALVTDEAAELFLISSRKEEERREKIVTALTRPAQTARAVGICPEIRGQRSGSGLIKGVSAERPWEPWWQRCHRGGHIPPPPRRS